jgi:hypothetical protein
MTQEDFLNRYNQSRTIKEALSKSISAAVQHNKLYNNLSNKERERVRDFWSVSLLKLSCRYVKEIWNEHQYEDEIIKLKNIMNDNFVRLIDFRISHSQKSISIFFKHMWCLGDLPIPPQCPVDRIILTRANAPYNERKWGFVNDIETHRKRYNILRLASIEDGFDNVSIWELENFQ